MVEVKIIGNKEKAYEESNRLLMVGHHNVIQLLNIVEDADLVGIMMQLMRMDLRMFMKRESDTFSTRSMQQIKLQTMLAVHQVHTSGLLHLDIKPENIAWISTLPHCPRPYRGRRVSCACCSTLDPPL